MKTDIAKEIENVHSSSSFENLCFNVLSKYKAERKSSLMSHLEYKFSHIAASSLADHNYPGANQSVNKDTLDIPSSKIDYVKKFKKKYSGK